MPGNLAISGSLSADGPFAGPRDQLSHANVPAAPAPRQHAARPAAIRPSRSADFLLRLLAGGGCGEDMAECLRGRPLRRRLEDSPAGLGRTIRRTITTGPASAVVGGRAKAVLWPARRLFDDYSKI